MVRGFLFMEKTKFVKSVLQTTTATVEIAEQLYDIFSQIEPTKEAIDTVEYNLYHAEIPFEGGLSAGECVTLTLHQCFISKL